MLRNLAATKFYCVGQNGGVLKIRGSQLIQPFWLPQTEAAIPNKAEDKADMEITNPKQVMDLIASGPMRIVWQHFLKSQCP